MPSFLDFVHGLDQGKPFDTSTVRLLKKDKTWIWCHITYTYQHSSNFAGHYVGTLSNVNEITLNLQKLSLGTEFDSLTGACNMKTFFEKAAYEIQSNTKMSFSIVCFDIANFKNINQLYGMREGDRLLRQVAEKTAEQLLPNELISRLANDTFAVLLQNDPPSRSENFVANLKSNLRSISNNYSAFVYFGICKVRNRKVPINVLCDRAQLALKTIKGSDLTYFAEYDTPLQIHFMREYQIRQQRHSALQQGQFLVYLQPKVEIFSGRITGAEALVRWRHPKEGILTPNLFIPLFERIGFIVKLDEYIWEATCKLIRHWINCGYTPIPISVNVSRIHFLDPEFSQKICSLTEKYQIPKHLLELEITESAYYGNEKNLLKVMKQLEQANFCFSMDDFGSGYSSLATLRLLPFKVIKLDRSMISDGYQDKRGEIVARYTVEMVKDLNIKIVAEGVENVDQAKFLMDIGCVYAQGYYYAKPMPSEEFEDFCFTQKKTYFVDPILQDEAKKLHLIG